MERIAIYPGSFDPVTNGHIDIVRRGAKLFDKVIVAIMLNIGKEPLFSVEERIEMLKESLGDVPNVEVDTFQDGLTVDYAESKNAVAMLRGMRAVSDWDSEFQLALINRRLNRNIETVFLMTGLRWLYISSSRIKEAAQFGGDIGGLVPSFVERRLKEEYSKS
jgi:pantetheine-phosphate adenylyltransferase